MALKSRNYSYIDSPSFISFTAAKRSEMMIPASKLVIFLSTNFVNSRISNFFCSNFFIISDAFKLGILICDVSTVLISPFSLLPPPDPAGAVKELKLQSSSYPHMIKNNCNQRNTFLLRNHPESFRHVLNKKLLFDSFFPLMVQMIEYCHHFFITNIDVWQNKYVILQLLEGNEIFPRCVNFFKSDFWRKLSSYQYLGDFNETLLAEGSVSSG